MSSSNKICSAKGMIVTDFDGTFADTAERINPKNYETLRRLTGRGFVRVLATGRNLYSCRRINEELNALFDYLIFSTGAGVLDLKTDKILLRHSLYGADIFRISSLLSRLELSFMMIYPIPDSNYFYYLKDGVVNEEFKARFALYREWGTGVALDTLPDKICSFLIFVPQDNDIFSLLCDNLSEFSVIYSTSPLGNEFTWIEVFPAGIDKGHAAAWLANYLHISRHVTMAVGNDYNDCALLAWAETSYVVANAPEELRRKHRQVRSVGDGGFAQAVEEWIGNSGCLMAQKTQ